MPKPNSPLLVLDLDGTLVDSVPAITASLNRVLAPMPALTRAEVVPMIGDGVAVLVGRALAARGMTDDGGRVKAMLADYTAHAGQEDALFAGVADTLVAAQGAWRLAVCTNKPIAATRALLAHLGIAGLFAAVGGGDSFPTRKPDPGHLLGVIAAAGGGPAVMVGDHAHDIRAARGASVPCIFAGWGYGPPTMADGAPVAARFADVPALAASLL